MDPETIRAIAANLTLKYHQFRASTRSQRDFSSKLQSCLKTSDGHGETGYLELARCKLGPGVLDRQNKLRVVDDGQCKDVTEKDQVELIKELLRWFKKDFFRWTNSPVCDLCATQTDMKAEGHVPPREEEIRYGAQRVESYLCGTCETRTRFPRYNDVGKLMETRNGRCGEWANVFTLFVRALGFEARYVVDWTDHVWTEVFLTTQNRWVHLDACEEAFDQPLLYETGWGKKLSYCVAFSNEQVVDVSHRYTKDWNSMLSRRTAVDETWLRSTIAKLNQNRMSSLSKERQEVLKLRDEIEQNEFDISLRAARENETVGRQSGSEEWRKERGEYR